MSAVLDPLFTPFRYGPLTLPTRLVMAPMTRNHCYGGVPTPEVAAYYRRRAEHGIGLIITEGVLIDDPAAGGYPHCPNLHDPAALAGWRQVVDEVHSVGGRIMPQIWHVGEIHRLGEEPHPELPGLGPREVRDGERVVVQAATDADLRRMIDGYALAARNARAVGFDGVEIHGAHGYLIDQFLWRETNTRQDAYGGSFTNRLRLAVEVVQAVRAAVGEDFPVVFRFSQWKPQDFRTRLVDDPEGLAQLLTPLKEAGVDIFHASTRRYWEAEFPGSQLNLAGWTRQLTNQPVITVGSVGLDNPSWTGAETTNLDLLMQRFQRGEFDLVAIGRALIADPAWAVKMREGRLAEIHPYRQEQLAILG